MSISICIWNRDFAVIAADRGACAVDASGNLYANQVLTRSKLHVAKSAPLVVAQVGTMYDDILDSTLQGTGTAEALAAEVWRSVYAAHDPYARRNLQRLNPTDDITRRAVSGMGMLIAGLNPDGTVYVASGNWPDPNLKRLPPHGFVAEGNYNTIQSIRDAHIDYSRINRLSAIQLCKALMNAANTIDQACEATGNWRGIRDPLDFMLISYGAVTPC